MPNPKHNGQPTRTAEAADRDEPSPRRMTRRRFLRGALVGTAALCSTGLYAREVEADRLVVTHTDIRVPGWPQAHAGLKVGQLTDFHCHSEEAVARIKRAVRMLLAEKPDIVFLTGDFLDSYSRKWDQSCVDVLQPLTAVPGGVYGVLGNHDWWTAGTTSLRKRMPKAGIRLLSNQSVPFPGVPGVWIVGLEDLCMGLQDPVRATKNLPKDAVKILLIHEPDYADLSPPGFALQISGHSHGGQVRLPLLPVRHTPRYAKRYIEGLNQGKSHQVYVSRGVGMVGPQVRLCCPPEVTVLHLYPE